MEKILSKAIVKTIAFDKISFQMAVRCLNFRQINPKFRLSSEDGNGFGINCGKLR
jgi:hypothetical protein